MRRALGHAGVSGWAEAAYADAKAAVPEEDGLHGRAALEQPLHHAVRQGGGREEMHAAFARSNALLPWDEAYLKFDNSIPYLVHLGCMFRNESEGFYIVQTGMESWVCEVRCIRSGLLLRKYMYRIC